MEATERFRSQVCFDPRLRPHPFGDFSAGCSAWATINAVAQLTAERLPATHVFISELIDSGRAFRLRATVGFEHDELGFVDGRTSAEQAATMSLLSKRLLVVDGGQKSLARRVSSMLGGLNFSSGASVPIRRGEDAWGVVGAYTDGRKRFDKSNILLLKSVADYLKGLLERTGDVGAGILAAKQEWEATVDSLSQLVIVLDSEARVIRTNRTLEDWGYGAVSRARGQPLSTIMKRIAGGTDKNAGVDWPELRKRLAFERLVEWELDQCPEGRAFRLALRAISGNHCGHRNSEACFAVLVIDDITGLKTARDAEKQLRVLSCQLIDAQEMERKKIAAELHDGIGQIMGAIKFQIEGLMACAGADSQSLYCEQLQRVVENVRYGMDEVRKIAMDLRPATLDDLGVILTINWFVREFAATYGGIKIEKKIDVEESAIIAERKIVIYRILQEAMNNVAKYAHATAIRLELSDRQDGLLFSIGDDGRGFDIDRLPRASCFQGFGLRSMRQRAELTGGVFAIDSIPGKGTAVQVWWPKRPDTAYLLRE